MSPEEFVCVAVGASPHDAEEKFDQWLRTRHMTRDSLAAGDVRADTVEKLMGLQFWRYWVRGSLVVGGR